MYPQIISFWTSPNASKITVWQLSEGGYSYKLESNAGSKIVNKSYDDIKLALTGRGYKESTDEQVAEGAIPLKGYGPTEYGIRWRAVKNDRQGSIVTKEKWFASGEALRKFANKLEDADGFLEIVAYSDPRGLDEADRNVDNTVKMTKSAFTNKPTASEPPAIEFDRKIEGNPYRQNRDKMFGKYYHGLNQGGQVMKEGWEGNTGWHLMAPDHEVIKQLDKANMAHLKTKYGDPNPALGYLGYVDEMGFVIAYYDNGTTKKGRPWGLDESVNEAGSFSHKMTTIGRKLNPLTKKNIFKKAHHTERVAAGYAPDDSTGYIGDKEKFARKMHQSDRYTRLGHGLDPFKQIDPDYKTNNGRDSVEDDDFWTDYDDAQERKKQLKLPFESNKPSGKILLAIDRALARDKKK